MTFLFRAARRRRAGSAAPSLSAQMEAMLAGTKGVAGDPTDLSTMWLEDTMATQLTGDGQTVGCLRTKWGVTQYDLVQATASARPVRTAGKLLTPDGVDDFLTFDGAFAVLNDAPGAYVAMRVADSINNNGLIGISTATGTNQRVAAAPSAGRLRTWVRRLDADAVTDDFGTNATIFSGLTIAFEQDVAVNGNAVKYRDNALIDTYTLAGSPANFSATDSARVRMFANLANTAAFFQTASIGRFVILPWVPTGPQRDLIQSWLTEV